jgi:type III pantothenate kinase
MQSGILYGTAAMIDGLIDQLSFTLNTTPKIIATGGMSKTIVPHCKHQITIDPYLLFKGLMPLD